MSLAFTDRYGTEMAVGGEGSFPACARVTVSKPCGIHVEAPDFPALIAALYGAAGQPEPVILERAEIDTDAETGINIFTVRQAPHPGSIAIRYHGAPSAAILAPGPARLLASVIATHADVAEAALEPDPGEVEELAQLLREHGDCGSLRWDAARAALRWFRDKQQRGEARDA